MSTPILSLVIFFVLVAILFFSFRREKGWFWIIRNHGEKKEKVWKEDILKLLYHTEKNNQSANLKGLAGALNMKESKALHLLEEMEEEGLLKATSAKISPTQSGKDYAVQIIRVHRLWEKYLSERTGFDKLEWHDRAEYMEHRLTERETNALASDLGHPRFDPHGDPIPTMSGEIAPINGVPLSQFTESTEGRIVHIEDEPEVLYRQIIKKDLYVGSPFKIISREKNITILSEGEQCVLNPLVASNITVVPLMDNEKIDESVGRLSNMKPNEKAIIVGISRECRGAIRRRLLDLGFVKGSEISIDNISPLGNPRAYIIRGTSIAIRNSRASQILIKKTTD